MEQVFAERRNFAVQHVFLPAVIYYYLQNIYKFYTIIFLFESLEYLLGQVDHVWQEDPGDSLIGDILMASLGMLAIREFKYESKPAWYIIVHIGILVFASVLTVQMWDEITWAYILYAVVACGTALLISIDWAAFSILNVIVIAAIATRGFMHPFSHTPIATVITLATTTTGLVVTRLLA